MKFETNRLRFVPVTRESLTALRSFHTDMDVMRYIGTGKVLTEVESEAVLNRYLSQESANKALGGWLLFHKESEALMGNAILRIPMTNEVVPGLEVGYMFSKDYWGHGFASETVMALLHYGYRETRTEDYVAMVRPGNRASSQVLIKNGFISAGKLPYRDPKTLEDLDLDFFKRKYQ